MSYERELSHAIRKKDVLEIERIFEQIYYKYGRLVGFIISKYVSNINDVEELTNDVFLNFSKVLQFIKLDNIKYYLVVQAKNTAINFVKKTSKLKCKYVDEWYEEKQDIDKDSMIYEVVSDMKKCLSTAEINIILLHAVYCYSFVELSRKLKKPVTTISSTYHRAIKKMKDFYTREDAI